MGNFIDLTGMTFGRLNVLSQADDYISPKGKHNKRWLCQCECGNQVIVQGDALKHSMTQSCGCYNKDRIRETSIEKRKHNKYNLKGEYGIGYDYNEAEFYFDLEDYDKIKDFYWYVEQNGYVRCIRNHHKIYLHRIIIDCDNQLEIDHINHNPSDNRKTNLRITTHQQNNFNKGLSKRNQSGIVGVSWNKRNGKWCATIMYNRHTIHLGNFDDINEAIKVRHEAEIKYFNEYRYKGDN